jgi:hypothetical protein
MFIFWNIKVMMMLVKNNFIDQNTELMKIIL